MVPSLSVPKKHRLKYGDEYTFNYGAAETYFMVHEDDDDLKPIRFDIAYIIEKNFRFWNPNHKGKINILAPNPQKIAGYGLPKKEQYFRREEYPPRLAQLEKRIRQARAGKKDLPDSMETEIWKYLSDHPEEYVEELAFVKKQVYHLLYGYWFYNNGIPTYIDGWHWLHLNYTTGSYDTMDRKTLKKVPSPYPEYRDRDRRKFLVWKYSLVDSTTFAKFHDDGTPIPEPDGTYLMRDMGARVWFGTVYPKHRRDGATTNILTAMWGLTIFVLNAYSSIIANREDTAQDHFNSKLVPSWRRWPFFFKPVYDGSDRPKTSLNFVAPAAKRVDPNLLVLEGKFDFAPVTDSAYYDGKKVTAAILRDEGGKTLSADIYKGHSVLKPSMSTGGGSSINPFALIFYPSTVEEMEQGGGLAYKKLVDDSDFYSRNKLTGQTKSGLFYFFMPAYDGLENFIGPYGESVIGNPTPEQAKFIGKDYGAKEHIRIETERLRSSDDADAREAADDFVRKHPVKFADCWIMKGSDLGFDQKKLKNRLDELSRNKKATVRGNFYWRIKGELYSAEQFIKRPRMTWSDFDSMGEVIWVPEEEGRFFVSKTLANPSQRERRRADEHWAPKFDDMFTASADPVMFNLDGQANIRSDKSRSSFPAGVVFENLTQIDRNKDWEDWTSFNFVCDYCHKTNDDDEYSEEMLMMCVYYGAMMYPETNIPAIVKWFQQRGYGGYLKYDWDSAQGKYKTKPGFNTSTSAGGGSKDELFTELKAFISRHIWRCNHINIINQLARIQKKEEMTKYDLIACAGGVLRSFKYDPVEVDYEYGKEKEKKEKVRISDWYGHRGRR